MLIYSAIAALFLALIHLFANKIVFSRIPRSKWLSIAGGISVAYVFIHLLPELEEWQQKIEEKYGDSLSFMSHHLYLVALLGLAIFYGMERAAKRSSESHRETKNNESGGNPETFWLHMSIFAVYNAIIGYLLANRSTQTNDSFIWFVVAMAFHFVVNDFGLLDHYRHYYLRKGRWIVALSVMSGWVIGAFASFSAAVIAILFAFVAGSIILNTLKEELPEERKSNFWAFFTGIVLYSILLFFA